MTNIKTIDDAILLLDICKAIGIKPSKFHELAEETSTNLKAMRERLDSEGLIDEVATAIADSTYSPDWSNEAQAAINVIKDADTFGDIIKGEE